MKILFLGDIAQNIPLENFKSFNKINHYSEVICNLEGAIPARPKQNVVCNAKNVLYSFIKLNITSVSLANNHFFDMPECYNFTLSLLKKSNINFFGAGKCLAESQKPLILNQGKKNQIFIYSFGWDVIGCKVAGQNTPGVNPLYARNLFHTINKIRKSDDKTVVIFMFHWNFELELYPQPMYRQLSRDLIDAGVDAIVGMHPHVAQGAELYKGKPIVYSLGNWFFPPRKLGSMVLKFPAIANRQLALEFDIKNREVIKTKFHWFQFNSADCSINFEASEDWSGKILQELTPFYEMNHKEYGKWFKKNRRKSFFLPIYYDYKNNISNKFKDIWVKARQLIIKLLLKYRLKNSPK